MIKAINGYAALAVISLILRLAAFMIDMPFFWDVQTFQAWAVMLFEGGFSYFYYSDAFTDYPPMYMYVLWIIGAVRYALGLDFLSPGFNFLIFLPAIISDIITVLLLYTLCRRIFPESHALLIAFAYSVNPAVILNSSVWGQVDAIHTLLLFLAFYYISKKQVLPVYLLYGIAVLTKPQTLIVAPIFLYSAFHYVKEREYSYKAALTMFGYAAVVFLFMAFLSLPFGVHLVIQQYIDTVGSRPFGSINAYNFYALTGGNWQPITLFYAILSVIAILGVTCMSFWILHRHWNMAAIFFTGALLYIVTFVFSVRMNERYLFPALLFMLVAACEFYSKYSAHGQPSDKRSKSIMQLFVLYIGFSATFFMNCLDVLLRAYDIELVTNRITMAHRPIDDFIAFISFLQVSLAIWYMKLGRDIGKWTDL